MRTGGQGIGGQPYLAADGAAVARPWRGRRAARGGGLDPSYGAIIGQVRWTIPFICLLLYIFAIVTYRLPIGTAAMIGALIGVAMQQERFRFPPLLLWFGVFLLWGLIGYVQTEHSAVVWDRLILLGKLWLIALVVVNSLRTWGHTRLFAIFFLLCFATHPARGAIFNYFGGYTVFGRALWNYIFENPNDLAALTLLPLSIAAILLRDRSQWVRFGARASVIVLPILILMTQSRGAFIALALFAAMTLMGERAKLRRVALLAIVGAVVVIAAPGGVWERISTLPEAVETDSSARQRWQVWRIALEISRDHPVLGVGLGAYRHVHAVYATRKVEHAIAAGPKDTHSTYLNILADAGYPGLILFLLTVAVPLLYAERVRRRVLKRMPERAVQIWYLEVGLLAYMVAAVFATYGHLSFLYIHLALLFAVADLARTELSGAGRAGAPPRRLRRRLAQA